MQTYMCYTISCASHMCMLGGLIFKYGLIIVYSRLMELYTFVYTPAGFLLMTENYVSEDCLGNPEVSYHLGSRGNRKWMDMSFSETTNMLHMDMLWLCAYIHVHVRAFPRAMWLFHIGNEPTLRMVVVLAIKCTLNVFGHIHVHVHVNKLNR